MAPSPFPTATLSAAPQYSSTSFSSSSSSSTSFLPSSSSSSSSTPTTAPFSSSSSSSSPGLEAGLDLSFLDPTFLSPADDLLLEDPSPLSAPESSPTAATMTSSPSPSAAPAATAAVPMAGADNEKPPYSYASLIVQAIESSPDKKITLSGIYSWVSATFPYYNSKDLGWQNSIRHNLSLNKCFIRLPRGDQEPGKGAFWAIEPNSRNLFEKGTFKKRRGKSNSFSNTFPPSTEDELTPQGSSSSSLPSLSSSPSMRAEHPPATLPAPLPEMDPRPSSPSLKRKMHPSIAAVQQNSKRRFSTSDALATEKAAAIMQQAKQTLVNRPVITFRRHSTPAVLPPPPKRATTPPSPTSFVIMAPKRMEQEYPAHRAVSHSPPQVKSRRSKLSGKPIEVDMEDGELREADESYPDGGFSSSSRSGSEPAEADLEKEDEYDGRIPNEETLRRLNASTIEDLGLHMTALSFKSASSSGGLHEISFQPKPVSSAFPVVNTTFEIPSHTSASTYQVVARTTLARAQGDIIIPGKSYPNFHNLKNPIADAPLLSPSALSFSPANMSFSPSMSLVASIASQNFAPGRGNGAPSNPKSTFSLQDLYDLDWSGNSALANEDIFFVKECADSTESGRAGPATGSWSSQNPADESGDFELVM